MNVLGVGRNYVVFAGKSTVYVRALPRESESEEENTTKTSNGSTGALLPDIKFPADWIAKDGHIECLAISSDDRFVAVSDSLHGLHVFKSNAGKWDSVFQGASIKRVMKLQFTLDSTYLTFLDKLGDIYAMRILEEGSKVSKARKIFGHTSFISDYVTRRDSSQIVSCDRDEKIRVSNFPDAFIIQGFKLGHTESIVSVAFVYKAEHPYLLSISSSGVLMLWDFEKPVDGTDVDFLKEWSIKEILPEEMREREVKTMKAISREDTPRFCVTFGGSTKITIFQLSINNLQLNVLHELETGSENPVTEWSVLENLLVYAPDLGSIRWWSERYGALRTDNFNEFDESVVSDMKALTLLLKPPTVPMKKRVTTLDDATGHDESISSAKKVKC